MIQAATTTPTGLVRPPRMTAARAYTRALSSIPGVSVSCGATRAPATAPSAAARRQPELRADEQPLQQEHRHDDHERGPDRADADRDAQERHRPEGEQRGELL